MNYHAKQPHTGDALPLDRNPTQAFMELALEEARTGLREGGIPIGAVLVKDRIVIGRGHNQRVQQNNQILHGEMACLVNAGRIADYSNTTLYTTLSPCMMCSGTIVQFRIPHVVIGENHTFGGNENFLRGQGIEVEILQHRGCQELMEQFIESHPELWHEDIGVPWHNV